MKPLVIYHAQCLDGFAAAFAAWFALGDDVEYVAQKYGSSQEPLPSVDGRDVYILDFSYPKPWMEVVFSRAARVVWLDHHKTAFESFGYDESKVINEKDHIILENPNHVITLDNGKSGALLAWEYFHAESDPPVLFQHIDDYDRWQFKMEGTKELVKAIWSYTPWTFKMWEDEFLFGDNGSWSCRNSRLIEEGEAILRAHNQNVRSVANGTAVNCCITERRGNVIVSLGAGLASNCPPCLQSDVGHELARASGTFALLWYINHDGKCLCSMRSVKDFDVSAIAKVFGGGGHKNAAGFEIDIQTLLGWLR